MTMRTLTVYFNTSSIDSTGYFNVLVSKEEKKLTGKKGGAGAVLNSTHDKSCALPFAQRLIACANEASLRIGWLFLRIQYLYRLKQLAANVTLR